VHCVFFPNER